MKEPLYALFMAACLLWALPVKSNAWLKSDSSPSRPSASPSLSYFKDDSHNLSLDDIRRKYAEGLFTPVATTPTLGVSSSSFPRALTDAGILVHAYLMYGFPTQTKKETVEALEYVRQLFKAGCIQSGYWHRFAATVHSPVGKNPEQFGIRLLPYDDIQFASNDIEFEDPPPCDHEVLGEGLKRALYNYMHGMGLNEPLNIWFDQPIPKPKVSADFIATALRQ